MRRFVAGWIFCLLASSLPAMGVAQAGTASQKGAAGPVAGDAVPLEKTEWSLIRLGRVAVKGTDLHHPPEIVLDPRRIARAGRADAIELWGSTS